MVRIELLPVARGDAIWIEYGEPKRPRRVEIDGDPAPAYEEGLRKRILAIPEVLPPTQDDGVALDLAQAS